MAITDRDKKLLETEFGRRILDITAPGTLESNFEGYECWELASQTGKDPLAGTDFGKTRWARVTEAAERANARARSLRWSASSGPPARTA